MICYCQNCRYTFVADALPDRCPDCGKPVVRLATEEEQAEYQRIQAENVAENWSHDAEKQ